MRKSRKIYHRLCHKKEWRLYRQVLCNDSIGRWCALLLIRLKNLTNEVKSHRNFPSRLSYFPLSSNTHSFR